MTTQDRLDISGWWPTKGTPRREEFVGPAVCSHCHADQFASQQTTPMAHAAMKVANSPILDSHQKLSSRNGQYLYQITRTEAGTTYSVSDGTDSISAALAWAFGIGEVGQTYVFQRGDFAYESRVSYYTRLQTLDITPGQLGSVPSDLENALGRTISTAETHQCFGCHTTASTSGGHFDPDQLIPGVTCEACHGPGVEHVVAMSTGQGTHGATFIFNPVQLKPVASVEFCGACHRTKWDVAFSGSNGIFNIRFAPYRLEESKCWGRGDPRLTCTACHDPHKPLVRDAASYDQRCLACHASGTQLHADVRSALPACPVSATNCVTCHMPKYEIPGIHARFTDHRIRVAREGEPFPK